MAPKGSAPPALTPAQVMELPAGTLLAITWDGGNGPHCYELCDEIEATRWGRLPFPVTRVEVVEDADYVSLLDRAEAGDAAD
jgi:hypothetical protein